uniref:Folate/biopterin transporter n=1 Tax=Chromera velia CCMP2878 TaxID=1169474 RepID=A0A0G4I6L7_9ALVE|eukprot:Cvel_1907.t1-p1 / transcript=Cvel_1907.t1 / gene=Cvel_1907 / organism=Chromera_velia_CCMP2878 / gene_product=Probable folate-biopterin transporter 6, putative / transcript_product=Probable folate-biopterin transporter 6, putative / location=Cvel_scaffold71:95457-103432(+) / protein_length=743 / sequence_SO=supercontig / SO=protein_coding / is_pseudo=false
MSAPSGNPNERSPLVTEGGPHGSAAPAGGNDRLRARLPYTQPGLPEANDFDEITSIADPDIKPDDELRKTTKGAASGNTGLGGNFDEDCQADKITLSEKLDVAKFVRRMLDNFGWRCTSWLVSMFFFIKGVQYSLMTAVQLPYCKGLMLDGVTYQTNSNISQIPWAMKGLVGFLSDRFPLFGYSKKYYMLVAAAIGGPALLCLALLPTKIAVGAPWVIGFLFFLTNVQVSSMDLLSEGKYSEIIRRLPATGSDMVSFVWSLTTIGALLGTTIIGPLADALHAPEISNHQFDEESRRKQLQDWSPAPMSIVFWICLPLALQIVIPVALNWMPERRMDRPDRESTLALDDGATAESGSVRSVGGMDRETARLRRGEEGSAGAAAAASRGALLEGGSSASEGEGIEERIVSRSSEWHPPGLTDSREATREETAELRDRRERQRNGIFTLAVVVSICALGLAVVSVLTHYDLTPLPPHQLVLLYAVGASTLCSVLNFLLLPPMMAKCNFYMFMSSATYILLPGALDYWYTAGDACVPNGPHFDNTFYITWTNFIGTFAQLLGVWLFQAVTSTWDFRSAFWITSVVQSAAAMIDLIIIRRWNVEFLGLSDKATYWVGSACILQLVSMLNFMPSCLLNAKLCPRNAEAASYAILAGFSNFGTSVSQAMGAFLIKQSDIRTTVPCNFDALAELVFFCHFVCPMLMVPLSFWLIPNSKMDAPVPGMDLNDRDEPHGGPPRSQIRQLGGRPE